MTFTQDSLPTLYQQTLAAYQRQDWPWINHTWQNLLGESSGVFLLSLDAEFHHQLLTIGLTILAEEDFQTRWELAKWWPKLGDSCLPFLLADLAKQEISPGRLWFVVKMLAAWPRTEVVMALAHLLQQTPEEDIQAIAVQTLSHMGTQAIAVLTELLTSELTRGVAIQTLAQIPHPAVIEPLLTVSRDDPAPVRAIAVAALGQFQEERVAEALSLALQDVQATVRQEAIMGLSLQTTLTLEERLQRLTPSLYDVNLPVCQQTAIALGRLSLPATAETLFQVLQSPLTPLPLQISVIQALGWLNLPSALRQLEKALTLPLSPEGLLEIVRVLGRSEHPSAVQILLQWGESNPPALQDSRLRQTLAYSLGQWQNPIAKSFLQNLAQDADKTVQLNAIAALKKIG